MIDSLLRGIVPLFPYGRDRRVIDLILNRFERRRFEQPPQRLFSVKDARFDRADTHVHHVRDFGIRQSFFGVEDQRLPLKFWQPLHRFGDFQVQQQPVRHFFGQRRAFVRQLEAYAHIHAVVLVCVDGYFLVAPLPSQNVVAAVARNAEHIRAQLFGRIELGEIDVQRHERILYHVLRLVAIPDQPPHEPR
jgi:hypothetical protein